MHLIYCAYRSGEKTNTLAPRVIPSDGKRRSRAYAVLIAAFCCWMASVPARAQMQLYHSLLHCHTALSDGDVLGAGGPTAQNLTTAAAAAKASGLTAFSTSDHGEEITSANYAAEIQQSNAATIPGILSNPNSFVALWGFEWTNAALNTSHWVAQGEGHLSIFGASDRTGAKDAGGGYVADTTTQAIYWSDYVNQQKTTNRSLWQWILDHRTSPLGGTIVCQINHPNLYPGATLANPSVHWTNTWWKKLEYVPIMDPYVTLMEMGSRNEPGASITGYWGGAYNEPYFLLALDNGWHLAPTNNEDNHTDHFGSLRTGDNILTETGIWAVSSQGLTPKNAQASVLGALRFRRTYSMEDRVTDPLNAHAKAITLKFTVQSILGGLRWMGWNGLAPNDVQNKRCHLEISRGAGLMLNDTSVQVITNRGAVAATLPLSAATIIGNTAKWDFSLSGNEPPAQLRAFSTVLKTNMATDYGAPPLPLPQGPAGTTFGFDASTSGRIQRYYYIRVQQTDGTLSYTAPVWIQRDGKIINGTDGIHAPISADVASFTFDYGDGTIETEGGTDAATPDGIFDGQTQHTYQTAGDYYPRVTVTYKDGSTDSCITRVWVGATAPTTPFYGDVNNDGQINTDDVQLLVRMAAGLLASDSSSFTRSDVFPPAANDPVKHLPGDKKISIVDALRLSRFMNGQTKVWP